MDTEIFSMYINARTLFMRPMTLLQEFQLNFHKREPGSIPHSQARSFYNAELREFEAKNESIDKVCITYD